MEGGKKRGGCVCRTGERELAPADDYCARETAHGLAARSKEKMRAHMHPAADPIHRFPPDSRGVRPLPRRITRYLLSLRYGNDAVVNSLEKYFSFRGSM
jgi:hypothetical protein